MPVRVTFILLALTPLSFSAEFTTAAYCETMGVSSVGSTSCHTEGTYTGPSVIIGPYQFADVAVTGNSFSVSGNTLDVREQTTQYVSPLSESDVYDAFSAVLFTPGPVRPGIITGSLDESAGGYGGGGARFTVTYPGYVFSGEFGSGAPPIPITLGQLFPLNLITQAHDINDDLTNATLITDLHLHLNFFEADGVTPANVFEIAVPEPKTIDLVLIAIAGAFVMSYLRTRLRSIRPLLKL
jgi:hypothetical protein